MRGTTAETAANEAKTAAFLSTYPVRGTTLVCPQRLTSVHISIHVPRAGYDPVILFALRVDMKFLSTYPVRGTTAGDTVEFTVRRISIHVPRAGYDRAV